MLQAVEFEVARSANFLASVKSPLFFFFVPTGNSDAGISSEMTRTCLPPKEEFLCSLLILFVVIHTRWPWPL